MLVFFDTPARRIVFLSTGHTSRSGCDKCGLRSVRTLACGTPLGFNGFAGYTAPSLARVYDRTSQVRPFLVLPSSDCRRLVCVLTCMLV